MSETLEYNLLLSESQNDCENYGSYLRVWKTKQIIAAKTTKFNSQTEFWAILIWLIRLIR